MLGSSILRRQTNEGKMPVYSGIVFLRERFLAYNAAASSRRSTCPIATIVGGQPFSRSGLSEISSSRAAMTNMIVGGIF